MTTALYWMARFFPFWAIPVGLVFVEIGVFAKRRGSVIYKGFFALGGMFFLLSLLWLVFRGDVHSDQWVRNWIQFF